MFLCVCVIKIKLLYFLGRMGINFHHPGTDNIMALNSKSSYEILYKKYQLGLQDTVFG